MGNIELEYNLAGGLLFTIREEDFKYLQESLVSSGYRYGCVLPFRVFTKEKGIEILKNSPLQIIHIEKAWNPTKEDYLIRAIIAGLIGYYRRFRGISGSSPIVQDALFPSAFTCERLFQELVTAFPEVKFISHDFDVDFPSDRLLIEINPGIKLFPSEILEKIGEKGIGLVFDPSHLLPTENTISFPRKPTKPVKGEWERQFEIFKPRIEVVDIHPPSNEDVKTLLKGGGLLKELAIAARETKVQFLRVEIPLPLLYQLPNSPWKEKGFEFLKEIGEALSS